MTLRLNTAIPPTAYANQNRLGLFGSLLGRAPQDLADYPNGPPQMVILARER